MIDTVAISSKGIRYSTILKKIDCDWKDIFRIEMVTHKSRSEQTGLVVSSTIEYIIFTSKGDFSLKEGSNWGWDAMILREIVYDKIISHAPDAKIIQREEESILHDTGGK
ncbi:hypothetical protein [Candidatus Methanoperedens nitratireducens]|uniref:Uncharacterized protein n=1 Tax=Candidatus Methanoperedens nitratireducens TaxID=1392998 RepID=A0A284VK87_9EURY|nr:hypothetical protein [Candidatus Methanoperedens nitroreducens]SNQ59694.1 hypothetical protein MNV_1270024 [Candidatus Methanoperedens nitroreducens]